MIFMATLFFYSCLIFSCLYILTKNYLLHKIQNLPPSPFPCLPIIGHLHLLKRPIHRTLSRICDQNGPVVLLKLGFRRVLIISSPSAVEECFTKNDIIFANRPRMIIGKYMHYNYQTMAWAPYGDHWRNLRRIASLQILSTHRLQSLYAIRQDEVKLLLRRLFRRDHEQTIVDFRKEVFELTLNIMMRMIAGKRYYGENLPDAEEARRFRTIQDESVALGGQTNLGDFLPWFRSKELEEKLIECGKKRDQIMQSLVEQYRRKMQEEDDIDDDDGHKRRKTMVEVLLSSQEKEPENYTDEIIKGLMLILLLGGTDTSINTMEWAFSLLLNHREVLQKVQTEIDEVVGHGRLVDETDLPQLPYLRSIIRETMRMYPALAVIVPHESSKQCTVAGYHIPQGTMLFVNVWSMQNDPKFWKDPTKFMPERFEGLDLKGATSGDFRMIPFGHGRRSCPGEGLALRVIGLTLGTLIQCFEWESLGGKMVDMTEEKGRTLRKAQSLKVDCRTRPRMFSLLSQL